MELRKHRWGLYFAVEDVSRQKPRRPVQDGIDLNRLKDIRPGNCNYCGIATARRPRARGRCVLLVGVGVKVELAQEKNKQHTYKL